MPQPVPLGLQRRELLQPLLREARQPVERHGLGAVLGPEPGDLAAETVSLSREELRERMSGNLCRCGAYNGIIDAIAKTYAEAAV